MINGPLRSTMAIALAAFCLLLAGGSDPQGLAIRRQLVAQMTPPEKARLYRLWERFGALPPERREHLRQLERQIAEDKHADELKDIMRRYYQWCRTLPAYQRLELLELPLEKRIAQIKELKRQSEDADGLKKWFEAKADQVADHLSDEQLKRLAAVGPYGKHLMLFRWMDGMTKESGKAVNNPLNDEDLADLRSQLSEPTQQALEKQTPLQQWKTIVVRIKRHFYAQARRHRFNRRRGIYPWSISNENLATRFQKLSPNRQDELLSLPAEEMLHQLQQIYMAHRFPKFRPRKTNNPTRRRPLSNRGSPRPPNNHPPNEQLPMG